MHSKPMTRRLYDFLLRWSTVLGTVILYKTWLCKCVLIGSICHAEDNSTKMICTSLPPGRTRGRSEERKRDGEGAVEESIRVRASQKHREREREQEKHQNGPNRFECKHRWCKYWMSVSHRQTGTESKDEMLIFFFHAKNDSSLMLLLWRNAARLEPHSTRYLPLKCSVAGIQIQQGCEKERERLELKHSHFVWIVRETLA